MLFAHNGSFPNGIKVRVVGETIEHSRDDGKTWGSGLPAEYEATPLLKTEADYTEELRARLDQMIDAPMRKLVQEGDDLREESDAEFAARLREIYTTREP